MAYRLHLTSPTPATVPADGWKVGYRILGSGGSYTTAGPFMSFPINIVTADPVGTLYEGYITRDCGTLESTQFFWQTPCNCTDSEFTVAPSGVECEKVETQPADVTDSGFCLATAQNDVYSEYGLRIYNTGFSQATMNITFGTPNAFIFGYSTTSGQWANPTTTSTIGPLNREGVWVDADCNGSIDTTALTATIGFQYTNPTTVDQQMFLGCGGDNAFVVSVNGVDRADTGLAGDLQFKIWHVIPVTMIPGVNYINMVSTNGGGDQSVGMVLYNNTAGQIQAAASDAALNILFKSSDLRGTSFDVATCDAGWSLDTSGGSGNYICVRTTYMDCNTL